MVHCAHDPLGWNGKLQHRESWHLGAGGTIRQTGQRERQLPCRAEAAHDRAFGRSEGGVVGVGLPPMNSMLVNGPSDGPCASRWRRLRDTR